MNTEFMVKFIMESLKREKDNYPLFKETIDFISDSQNMKKNSEDQEKLRKSVYFFMNIRKLISKRLNNMETHQICLLMNNDKELSDFLEVLMEEIGKGEKI